MDIMVLPPEYAVGLAMPWRGPRAVFFAAEKCRSSVMKFLIAFVTLAVLSVAGTVAYKQTTRETGSSPTASGRQIETIAKGERVDVNAHLAAGRHTVVYFYADW